MKTFCITMIDHTGSLAMGERCVESGKQFGVDVELFTASNQATGPAQFERYGFLDKYPNGITDRPDWANLKSLTRGEAGCTMSHYRLWNLCVALDEPIMVLEHDAIFIGPVPDIEFDEHLDIAKHMARGYASVDLDGRNEKILHPDLVTPGVHDLPYGRTLGSHGYMISPKGAHKCIQYAINVKAQFADWATASWVVRRQIVNPTFINIQQIGPSTTSRNI